MSRNISPNMYFSRYLGMKNRFRRISRICNCSMHHHPVNNTYEQRSYMHSYTSQEGTVEGVWVFARHGDRTPSRSLLSDDQRPSEEEFWKTKLPQPEYIDELNEMFPVDRHESLGEEYLDVKRFPYGFLTELGTKQMKRVGQKFNLRNYVTNKKYGSAK